MSITGHNLLGAETVAGAGTPFRAVDPASGEKLEPEFREADAGQVDHAVAAAEAAFRSYGRAGADVRAHFLRAIADELIALGDVLIERAHAETALPGGRLQGERGRTVHQLRLFADVLDEGSWVEARIDPGDRSRTPLPKPDVRRMLVPLGPVAVFGASNFPFAFSVPGGDTASALAAGCTVVCKGHPAHPGTSELAAGAIRRAARATGLPDGVFSLVHGWSHEVGTALVRHPLIAAVGFTGSLRGGRAIFDAASARPVPIPVYAEMGSINPVFLLPSALEANGDDIANALARSITLGVGQFCTNPGVLLGLRGAAFEDVGAKVVEQLDAAEPGVMLYDRLADAYVAGVERAAATGARRQTAHDDARGQSLRSRGRPTVLAVGADRFASDAVLREEVFGPASILVTADDEAGLERAAEALEGQLTATVFGSEDDLRDHAELIAILERKVGRIVFNGVPTGVEVGHAMHHGGPYPASSDARTTSVGSAAILRFARPVCYQDFPDAALPPALRNRNELGIWRLVDGRPTRDDL